jgi:hypothetical protein
MTARARKGLPGHDCRDMTAKPGQDSQVRTARKKAGGTTRTGQNWTDKGTGNPTTDRRGHAVQDRQNKAARKELPGQNCQDRTVRTGLAGQESQNRTARTKQTENDRQNSTARGQDSRNKLVRTVLIVI